MDATFDALDFDPTEQVVLVVEPPQTELFRKEFVEYLFETSGVSGLYFKNALSLAAYLHSKEFALVVDVGGHNTSVAAVSEGDVVAQS